MNKNELNIREWKYLDLVKERKTNKNITFWLCDTNKIIL